MVLLARYSNEQNAMLNWMFSFSIRNTRTAKESLLIEGGAVAFYFAAILGEVASCLLISAFWRPFNSFQNAKMHLILSLGAWGCLWTVIKAWACLILDCLFLAWGEKWAVDLGFTVISDQKKWRRRSDVINSVWHSYAKFSQNNFSIVRKIGREENNILKAISAK